MNEAGNGYMAPSQEVSVPGELAKRGPSEQNN